MSISVGAATGVCDKFGVARGVLLAVEVAVAVDVFVTLFVAEGVGVAVGMVPGATKPSSSAAVTIQFGSAKRIDGCSRKKAIVLHSVPAGTSHRSMRSDLPSFGESIVTLWTVSG